MVNHMSEVQKHFRWAAGVPMSVLVAMMVVTVFRATEGPIEFKGLGFEFKGASGPVVLWVFVFLACVVGTSTLY
jgi:ABC-type transport system involved in cytochrome c biogenesis permease component